MVQMLETERMVALGAALVALGSVVLVSSIFFRLMRSVKRAPTEQIKIDAPQAKFGLGSHNREKAAWLVDQLQDERAGLR
jgi:hypothetical protein